MGEFALVALGSNASSHHGTPRETLERAFEFLDASATRLVRASALYLTPFFPAGSAPDVVNAVALVATDLAPADLLAHLHAIEAAFGRSRAERWGNRTLDLDLLAMGDRVLPDAETLAHWMQMPLEDQKRVSPEALILPHPRLQERAFVLVPAADVVPDWRHPLTGLTIREMRDALPAGDVAAVRRLA